MKHLKTFSIFIFLSFFFVGFFTKIETIRAYYGQGPYAYLTTYSFPSSDTVNTTMNLSPLDWNANWVPSSVTVSYTVDAPLAMFSQTTGVPFWQSATINLGALSAGGHTISFGLFGSNPDPGGNGSVVWSIYYDPISFNVSPAGTVNFNGSTVKVSSNISSSWVILGPRSYKMGSGTSQSLSSQPAGVYTITWNPVYGYKTPATESLYLNPGGTITFTGNYTVIPTGTWTAPICPTVCGQPASNPPYTCVGGNRLCAVNTPATLACNATAECYSCSTAIGKKYTQAEINALQANSINLCSAGSVVANTKNLFSKKWIWNCGEGIAIPKTCEADIVTPSINVQIKKVTP